MSLTLDDVRHIAKLGRIELSPGEDEVTLGKLSAIFGLIEAMQAVDTSGVEPMSHPQDLSGQLSQRLRPDAVTESDRREAFQAVAPQTEAGLYLVPKVIE